MSCHVSRSSWCDQYAFASLIHSVTIYYMHNFNDVYANTSKSCPVLVREHSLLTMRLIFKAHQMQEPTWSLLLSCIIPTWCHFMQHSLFSNILRARCARIARSLCAKCMLQSPAFSRIGTSLAYMTNDSVVMLICVSNQSRQAGVSNVITQCVWMCIVHNWKRILNVSIGDLSKDIRKVWCGFVRCERLMGPREDCC